MSNQQKGRFWGSDDESVTSESDESSFEVIIKAINNQLKINNWVGLQEGELKILKVASLSFDDYG